MRIFMLIAAVLAAIVGAVVPRMPVEAGRGIPGSPEFGYGARLELDGLYLEQALELAADIRFDWLAVPVRWSALQPGSPYAARLDDVMAFAARNQMAVMISLTQPPASALTASGPDPLQTATLVQSLAQRYSGTLQAVELFPAANLRAGWGAEPDPRSYASLYNQVSAQMAASNLPVLLIGGGLQPVAAAAGQMDDLAFLQAVYDAGAYPPVVSLLISDPDVDPLAAPGGTHRGVLRHYEEVRQVMTRSGQENCILWITAIRAPSGTINVLDDNHSTLIQLQNTWLYQAYAQMRSQLYIGVSIYQSLNPVDPASAVHALVTSEQYHPAASIFRDLVRQNGGTVLLPRYGRPKNEGLLKQKP